LFVDELAAPPRAQARSSQLEADHRAVGHSSWLNQVEALFSILTRRSLKFASFPSKAALRRHLRAFLADWNRNPT